MYNSHKKCLLRGYISCKTSYFGTVRICVYCWVGSQFWGLYCENGSLHVWHNVDLQMLQSFTQVQTLLPLSFWGDILFITSKLFFVKKNPSLYKGVLVLEKFNFIHGLSFISPLLFGQQLLINQFNGWKNNIVNFKPKTHLEEGISSRHGSDWY